MVIKRDLLTPNKYSRPQTKLEKVTKIAVHYTGNPNSSAKANRDYFESLKNGKKNTKGNYIYASSHYIIGLDGEILQLIPHNEISYCTNSANVYSISIECCHPDATGRFNDKTLKSLIGLCQSLCKEYKLDPLKDLIRHYDVTQKSCPLWFVNHEDEWIEFKKQVKGIDEIQNAVDILHSKGVVNTVSAWNTLDAIEKSKKYLPELIANFMRDKFDVKVCCYNDSIVGLFQQGIISDLSVWAGLENPSANNIRFLLIKMAKEMV